MIFSLLLSPKLKSITANVSPVSVIILYGLFGSSLIEPCEEYKGDKKTDETHFTHLVCVSVNCHGFRHSFLS